MKVSLVSITHLWGEKIIQNLEVEKKYNLSEDWILKKTGVKQRHAWSNGLDSLTFASLRCLDLLLEQSGIEKSRIKAVFGITNLLRLVNPPITQQFAEKAGLISEIFEENFGCGGPAITFASMYKWFQNQPENTYAIFLTQDWPTKMTNTMNLEVLLSDAVSVSLWTNGAGIMEVVDFFSDKTTIKKEHLGIFDGFWIMDGGKVSEAVFKIPELFANRLKINLNDYEIAPHQANPRLLKAVELAYEFTWYKEAVREHGNPTCSGALIALEDVMKENSNKPILTIFFGAGGMGGFILKK